RIDGEAFEGGSGDDIEVTLGDERFLPDLERALVGRSAAEQFQTEVAFPDDYGASEVAGKTATFDVTVKQVSAPMLPELDEEFLQQMGIEEGGVESFRDKVRESLEKESANAVETRIKTQVMDALHEANPLDVPQALVEQEIDRMRKESMARMPEQAQNDEELARQLLPDEALRDNAQRRVALGLLINEVISERGIELDNERLEAK